MCTVCQLKPSENSIACLCVRSQALQRWNDRKQESAMTSRGQHWDWEGWEGWLSVRSEKLCSGAPWKRWKQQKKKTVAKEPEPKGKEIHRKESHTCSLEINRRKKQTNKKKSASLETRQQPQDGARLPSAIRYIQPERCITWDAVHVLKGSGSQLLKSQDPNVR